MMCCQHEANMSAPIAPLPCKTVLFYLLDCGQVVRASDPFGFGYEDADRVAPD